MKKITIFINEHESSDNLRIILPSGKEIYYDSETQLAEEIRDLMDTFEDD